MEVNKALIELDGLFKLMTILNLEGVSIKLILSPSKRKDSIQLLVIDSPFDSTIFPSSHSKTHSSPLSPVTARLKEAGSVIIGKTTTPEFGHRGTTQSPLTGITRNPWNLERTSGGSSGGSSSSVASGMGPLAIGTDGGGSVRIPCAYTGLFGIKPTFGKIPAWPLSPFGTIANVGPMTRTVKDGAMLYAQISQPDCMHLLL